MSALQQMRADLNALANAEKAKVLQRYFKTGKGEYADGDVFLGISVPVQRQLAQQYYKRLTLKEVETLLQSGIHEHRLTALLVWVLQFQKTKSEEDKKAIVDLYLNNTAYINNWDLVDSSAPYILGAYLFNKPKTIVYQLAQSNDLWKQRIAILSTSYFIKQQSYDDTLAIAKILLHHPHDLIHKATGWMLREIGNRNADVAVEFLVQHYRTMPRTMLRYAIEKYPPPLKEQFMKGTI